MSPDLLLASLQLMSKPPPPLAIRPGQDLRFFLRILETTLRSPSRQQTRNISAVLEAEAIAQWLPVNTQTSAVAETDKSGLKEKVNPLLLIFGLQQFGLVTDNRAENVAVGAEIRQLACMGESLWCGGKHSPLKLSLMYAAYAKSVIIDS